MTKTAQNYTIYAGDTVELSVSVTDSITGAAKNITGATIKWVLYNSRSSTATLTKTTASGITITDGVGGLYIITATPVETAAITPDIYYHESEITDSGGRVSTVFTGNITVKPSRI